METAHPSAIVDRKAAFIAVVAGIALFITTLGILFVQPNAPTWMPNGFITPILALEFATDIAVVRQMLGDDAVTAEALMHVVKWDMAFLCAYAVFLIAVITALIEKGVLRYIALFFAAIAPLADIAENLQLLTLLEFVISGASFRAEAPIDFSYLRLAAVMKFGAIAIVHIRLMRVVIQQGHYGRVLAAFLLGSIVATGASFYTVPYALDIAMTLVSICWLMLWAMMLSRLRAA